MSVDLLVILAASKAPSWDAWTHALSENHTPVGFTQAVDLHRHTGFLPVQVNGRNSGFYFHLDSYTELAARYSVVRKVHLDKPTVYSLSFGGLADECSAAFLSASILVSRFEGVAFDPQGGTLMTAKELTDAATRCSTLSHK